MKEANQTYVGIDISKDTLDVALRPSDRTWQVSYTEDGIRKLVGEVGPLQPELVVMEATGGFEALLVSAMVEEGLRVVVVNSSGPHHQDSGEAKIRESTAGVSRKPSSDGKACGCSSKHLCGLTAWNT